MFIATRFINLECFLFHVMVSELYDTYLVELKMVQSRLGSNVASVFGHIFESYEDTIESVVAQCSSDD
jgi:hypothetical protein